MQQDKKIVSLAICISVINCLFKLECICISVALYN